MNKSLIILFIVIGAGLLLMANIFRDKPGDDDPNLTPGQTESSPSLSPTPVASSTPSISLSSTPLSKAATCQISGEIKYVGPNIYETKAALIKYQNVDDNIRQIFWTSNPADGALAVGPNLFEELKIPNGEAEVGVDLRKTTNVKSYTLTARINYGQRDANGVVQVKETKCSGLIKVTMP